MNKMLMKREGKRHERGKVGDDSKRKRKMCLIKEVGRRESVKKKMEK